MTRRLTFVGTDSGGGHCPTLYATDRGTVVVQGNRVADPDAVADLESTYGGLPEHETAVEIPVDLLRNWALKAIDAAESQASTGSEPAPTVE